MDQLRKAGKALANMDRAYANKSHQDTLIPTNTPLQRWQAVPLAEPHLQRRTSQFRTGFGAGMVGRPAMSTGVAGMNGVADTLYQQVESPWHGWHDA